MLPHMKVDFVYVAIGIADNAERILNELDVRVVHSSPMEEEGQEGFEVGQLTSEQVKMIQDRIPGVLIEPDLNLY